MQGIKKQLVSIQVTIHELERKQWQYELLKQ